MRELSLNLLDIALNSVAAGAQNIGIVIRVETGKDRLTITISDDGFGMDEEFLKKAVDPFATTRKTRKVGLGLPLFKEAALITGGSFDLNSKLGAGTTVVAGFALDNIDRMPLGDIPATMITLVTGSPDIEFKLCYSVDGREFVFDTAEIKETLAGVPIDSPEVAEFLTGYLAGNIDEINGGLTI